MGSAQDQTRPSRRNRMTVDVPRFYWTVWTVTGAGSAEQSSAAALGWQSRDPPRPGSRSPGAGMRVVAPPFPACRSTVLVPPVLQRAEKDHDPATATTG